MFEDREVSDTYSDIIDLPHHVSRRHPPLSMEMRAAQFSPFAALTGFEASTKETARLTQRKIDLSEEELQELDRKYRYLVSLSADKGGAVQPGVKITYFEPDPYKEGGMYVTVTGTVKKIRSFERTIQMDDGTSIAMDDIADINIMTGDEHE